jgi:subtilase family serine protease
MKVDKLSWSGNVLFGCFLLAISCLPTAAQTPAQPAALQTANVPARITSAVDETNRVTLRGNVHPLARAEFDRGVAPAELPMQRMLLMLKRSSEQQAALSQLMVDQYNTASPNFHQWLTPDQFGQQFGPADADVQAVTAWLQAHGFQVAKVSKGKIAVEFSGNAGQVKEAFRTEIHKYVVDGESHWANASDPQIPAALAPVVNGTASLHNFRPKPMHHVNGAFTKARDTGEVQSVQPEFTTPGGNFGLGPTDFATIYNVLPLWNAGTPIDGTGQSIAVIGVSNINLQDITDFRTVFGLPASGTSKPIVVIDGSDPGVLNDASGSETEALTDVEWSGAIAKGAQIHFVISADTDSSSGLLLAAFHVIDTNSDPVMSLSFGNCEQSLGTNGNLAFNGLWEQAAAQGITVTISTGDSGSAGCEDQNAAAPNPATTGLQVSGFASTPFNVAVGGTDFNDNGTQTTYFGATSAQNDPTTLLSAKSYIPESTWNESCTNAFFGSTPEANCNSSATANKAAVFTVGGSGGVSHCTTVTAGVCSGGYTKPAYQSFITALQGMPADGHRDLPDVSLFASSGFNKSFYVVCEADASGITASMSCKKGTTFQFLGIGGTSVSTPSFAGIMALVNQKTGQRQGNANFVLYKLAQQQFTAGTACTSQASPLPAAGCTFNDVTVGTNAVPCKKGSTDCTTTGATDTIGVLNGFAAGTGYDLATGLGSVNATNLVNGWATGQAAFRATTTTLGIAPMTGITAGTNVTVNVNVTPTAGSGTPSGDVGLVSAAASGEGVTMFTLTAGAVTNGSTNQLTGGTYNVTAHYAGDGTFAPSDSTPVSVTVGKASSTTVASVLSSSGGGNFAPFTSGPGPVTLFLSAIVNQAGVLLPTGTVTFVDNGSTTVAANVRVDSSGEAFTAAGISFTTGAHSIVAQYSGDNSFNSSNATAVTFTVNAATATPTTTTVTPSVTTVASGGSVMLTAKVTTASTGAGPTGTVQFMNGTSTLGAAATCTPTAGSGSTMAFCTATLTTALSFLAPPAQPRQIPKWPTAPMWITAWVLFLAFLLSLKRLPAARRRGYVYAGVLLFACVAAGIAGCSGMKTTTTGVTPHTDNITAVYSGDTNFATSTSAAVGISIH